MKSGRQYGRSMRALRKNYQMMIMNDKNNTKLENNQLDFNIQRSYVPGTVYA